MSRRQRPSAPGIAACGCALAFILTGCTFPPTPPPTSTQATGTGLGLTCDQLVPAPVRDGLQPGMKPTASFKPAAGTYPAKIVALGGTACQWQAPNGIAVDVTVGKLTPSTLATNQAKVAASSTSTLAFGDKSDVKGYVSNTGGTYSGDMEVFTADGYWVSAQSPLFTSPSNAESVIGAVLQAVPSG